MTTSNELTRQETMGFDPALIVSAIRSGMGWYHPDMNDAASQAIGAAISSYKEDRGMELKSWVVYYVRNCIRRLLSRENSQYAKAGRKTVSLDAENKSREGEARIDSIPSRDNVEDAAIARASNDEQKAMIKAALDQMDERGKFVINFLLDSYRSGRERCLSDLGEALVKAGIVKGKADAKDANRRERARQLANQYMAQVKAILSRKLSNEQIAETY